MHLHIVFQVALWVGFFKRLGEVAIVLLDFVSHFFFYDQLTSDRISYSEASNFTFVDRFVIKFSNVRYKWPKLSAHAETKFVWTTLFTLRHWKHCFCVKEHSAALPWHLKTSFGLHKGDEFASLNYNITLGEKSWHALSKVVLVGFSLELHSTCRKTDTIPPGQFRNKMEGIDR